MSIDADKDSESGKREKYLGELDGLSRSLEAFPGALKSFIEAWEEIFIRIICRIFCSLPGKFAEILSQQKPSPGPKSSLTPVLNLHPIWIIDSHLRTLTKALTNPKYCTVLKTPVLWIRIDFNAHPDSAFFGQCRSGSRHLKTYNTIVKFYRWKIILHFLIKNSNILFLRLPRRTSKLNEKPQAQLQKRTSSTGTSKTKNFFTFSFRSICPSGSGPGIIRSNETTSTPVNLQFLRPYINVNGDFVT